MNIQYIYCFLLNNSLFLKKKTIFLPSLLYNKLLKNYYYIILILFIFIVRLEEK